MLYTKVRRIICHGESSYPRRICPLGISRRLHIPTEPPISHALRQLCVLTHHASSFPFTRVDEMYTSPLAPLPALQRIHRVHGEHPDGTLAFPCGQPAVAALALEHMRDRRVFVMGRPVDAAARGEGIGHILSRHRCVRT